MKVAILTFAHTNNYGATLQCYALNKYINSLGHESIILNVPLDDGSVRPKLKYSEYKDYLSIFYRIKLKAKSIYEKITGIKVYEKPYVLNKEQKEQSKKYSQKNMQLFDAFRYKYLNNISCEYFDFEDFENNYPVADAYIVGSDQVWNLWVTKWQFPIFFLDFVHKGSIRLSYAACMGGDGTVTFNNRTQKKIKKILSKFDYISVRDKQSVSILKNNFNILPKVVLDPTFLIDNYDELLSESNINAKGCIFSFKFVINDSWVEVLKTISQETGYVIKMDTCLIEIPGLKYRPECSVYDWLKLIKTSEFIFTDSFHCCVFCILFKKQFVVTPSYKGGEGRMIDLLEKFGINDRFFREPSEVIKSKVWERNIDYDKVYDKMRVMQEDSRNWINSIINKN